MSVINANGINTHHEKNNTFETFPKVIFSRITWIVMNKKIAMVKYMKSLVKYHTEANTTIKVIGLLNILLRSFILIVFCPILKRV